VGEKTDKYTVPEWNNVHKESSHDCTNNFTNAECCNCPGIEFFWEAKTRFNLQQDPGSDTVNNQ